MKGLTKSLLCVAVMGSVVTASAQFPLKVDIDVNAKVGKTNVGAGDGGDVKIENVQCHVKVRKSAGQPYTDPLTAELYVIGRQLQTGYYGIIDVVKQDFTFTKENDNTFEFTSKSYPLPQTRGNANTGATYVTYLLVVVDKDGKIVDSRSGRAIKERGIAFIRELGPMTLFDRDGNVIGKVENPGEAVKRAAPAVLRDSSGY